MSVVDRRAARVLLVDPGDRVLLFRGGDPARPDAGTWWFTPGGGLDPGECDEDAARREVLEETGLELGDLGPVIGEVLSEFDFGGRRYRQHNVFYGVRVSRFEVETSGWSQIERNAVVEHRWWTVDELVSTSETVYPPELGSPARVRQLSSE